MNIFENTLQNSETSKFYSIFSISCPYLNSLDLKSILRIKKKTWIAKLVIKAVNLISLKNVQENISTLR
jgi:hypothetical protein